MEDAMHYSFLLLTASIIPGAPGDMLAEAKAQGAPTTLPAPTTSMPVEGAPAPRPTFGQRLRNLFAPQRAERPDLPMPMLEPREVHVATTPAMTPAPQASATGPVTTVTAMRPSYDLTDKDLKQVGHETDYSWLTGRLVRAPGASGRWMLRYTAPYEQDRYGGAVLLNGSADLASYHEGDLICVHGKVAGGFRSGGSATYQVMSVDMIKRAAH
jgi:hypothetical protein